MLYVFYFYFLFFVFFFFNDTATTEIYTLSLHDALPIPGRPCTASPWSRGASWWVRAGSSGGAPTCAAKGPAGTWRRSAARSIAPSARRSQPEIGSGFVRE